MSKSSIVTNSSNKSESKPIRKKRHIASASTALLFGTVLGLIQAATLIFAAKPLLGAMGLKYVCIFIIRSTMFIVQYLITSLSKLHLI